MVEARSLTLPSILVQPTHPKWLPMALDAFDAVLIDHAHCEKKAAAAAMSLVATYPENSQLVQHCIGLAQEELRHFKQVHRIILRRGLTLTRDPGDPYARALLSLARHGVKERLLDKLLICALIEARSCERLALLAEGLTEIFLKRFYETLARAEAGHHALFVNLAEDVAGVAACQARLGELAREEAALLGRMPLAPRIH